MSLGFEQAGFDVVAAVEIDPVHCAVHKFNFPNTVVIPKSVEELTAEQIREVAGIRDRRVDCVFGGAPCQGFSMIGRRALDDPRNRLVLEFVRIVSELNASTFVFENVKGLTVGKHRGFLDELVAAFQDAGYYVRLPWHVLNAADYGVPQHRERLILFGAKNGIALPDYPLRTTNPADSLAPLLSVPYGPTCFDALGDLPDISNFEVLRRTDEVSLVTLGDPSDYARELRVVDESAWHFGYRRNWTPEALTSSARTEHTPTSQRRFRDTTPGSVEPISRFLKLAPDGLANTLRAGTDGARGAFTSPRPIHFAYSRCISVREMARLHGFPDWFRLHATKWHGARQIGNSVPPPLARAVATSVIEALGVLASKPSEVLQLREARLLSFDMSKASAHFGVRGLSGRRDRKSGAKKRKQHEIEALQTRESFLA